MIEHLVQIVIQKEILDEEHREEYVYALTTMFEKVIAYSIILIVAILIGEPLHGMLFAVSFVVLRQTTGGFHAESFLGCLIGSVLTLLVTAKILMPLLQRYTTVIGILLLLSVLCILCFAPVNHPNLVLTRKERKRHKYLSICVLCVELGIIGIGEYLQEHFQRYMVTSIIICALFILLAKIIRQEVKYDEKE